MLKSKTVIVFIPCHNRKKITLAFLEHLHKSARSENIDLISWLLDDGSTDGTHLEVQEKFCNCNIIKLNGNAFWGGALNKIKDIVEQNYSSDDHAILVCNDDIRLKHGALSKACELLQNYDIVCPTSTTVDFDAAQEFSGDSYDITYFGTYFCNKNFQFYPLLSPSETNIGETYAILTRSSAWQKINKIPSTVPHYLSDYWLTYSFSQAGCKIITNREFCCIVSCKTTFNQPDAVKSIFDLISQLFCGIITKRKRNSIRFTLKKWLHKLESSLDKRRSNYQPAFIEFRRKFSRESMLFLKIFLMQIKLYLTKAIVKSFRFLIKIERLI